MLHKKNDSGELSLKGFKVQGSGFKVQLIVGFSRIVSLPLEGKAPRRGG